jgi:hypothetical protein
VPTRKASSRCPSRTSTNCNPPATSVLVRAASLSAPSKLGGIYAFAGNVGNQVCFMVHTNSDLYTVRVFTAETTCPFRPNTANTSVCRLSKKLIRRRADGGVEYSSSRSSFKLVLLMTKIISPYFQNFYVQRGVPSYLCTFLGRLSPVQRSTPPERESQLPTLLPLPLLHLSCLPFPSLFSSCISSQLLQRCYF